MQVIQGAEQKRHIKGLIRKSGKLQGISLIRLHVAAFFLQYAKVTFDKLYRCHIQSHFGKCHTIAAGSRSDIQNTAALLPVPGQIFLNVAHRRLKLYLSVAGQQSFIFVKFIIVCDQFFLHILSFSLQFFYFLYMVSGVLCATKRRACSAWSDACPHIDLSMRCCPLRL